MSWLLEAARRGRRVLLERRRGRVVLKFTASEEMLPLSSGSQSPVSPCEVYTLFYLVAADAGRTERLLRRRGTSNGNAGRDGDLPAAGRVHVDLMSPVHSLKELSSPLLWFGFL